MELAQLEDYLANEERLVVLLREVNAGRRAAKKQEISLSTIKGEYQLAITAQKAAGVEDKKTALQALIDYQTANDL